MLDTNAWLWSFLEPGRLPPAELSLVRDRTQTFGLSIMSIWEAAKKSQIGKLKFSVPFEQWLPKALTANVALLHLSPDIIVEAMQLPSFPNRDPADELIVATASAHGLTLLTSDRKLRGYKHARIHYFKPRPD